MCGCPRSFSPRFQVAEYLRAFLAGRVAQSAANGLLIISGAFGLFRRDAVLRVGGFRTDTIGEDMEIIVRLHRQYCDRGEPYRIVFRPDPVCWTEVPESVKVLGGQRNRWQRGTLQVLRWHRDMMFKPRYGVAGMLALPYFFIFEALGPFIEVAGYVTTIAAVSLGLLDWRFAQLLFLLAICYGALISLAAVLLEELSFRRYPRIGDLLRLALLGIIENFGYRQLSTWWRLRGTIDFFRGQSGWGEMTRQGFQRPDDLGIGAGHFGHVGHFVKRDAAEGGVGGERALEIRQHRAKLVDPAVERLRRAGSCRLPDACEGRPRWIRGGRCEQQQGMMRSHGTCHSVPAGAGRKWIAQLIGNGSRFERDANPLLMPCAPGEPRAREAFDHRGVGAIVHDRDRRDRWRQAIDERRAATAVRVRSSHQNGTATSIGSPAAARASPAIVATYASFHPSSSR